MRRIMETARIIIALAFMAIVMAVGLFDLWAMATGQPKQTVSAVIQDWSQQFPSFSLVCGFILGHLFWPVR